VKFAFKPVQLLTNAVVANREQGWVYRAQGHGPGSVVTLAPRELQGEDIPFSPTGLPGDIPVRWADTVGRVYWGWLAQNIQYKPAKGEPVHVPYDLDAGHATALDELRSKTLASDGTVMEFIACNTAAHAPLLRRVVRELGGAIPKTDDADTLARIALRVLLNREVTMSEVQEARESASETSTRAKGGKKGKKGKKGKGKGEREVKRAVEREADGPGRAPAGVSVGERLVKLLPKNSEGRRIAQKLASAESVSAKQLESLRDGINEAAAAAREKENGELASQLSSENRLVRRLARAARG
jgi:hypothetical protein